MQERGKHPTQEITNPKTHVPAPILYESIVFTSLEHPEQ
jgi:hypothetical protein